MLDFKKKIEKNSTAYALYKKLINIRNDEAYALCLIHDLDNDYQYKQLSDLIDSGITDTSDLIYYALKISGVKSIPISKLKEYEL